MTLESPLLSAIFSLPLAGWVGERLRAGVGVLATLSQQRIF